MHDDDYVPVRDEDYTYAVARIRSNERILLSNQNIEQLMASANEEECLKLLIEKGWGDGTQSDSEALLSFESERTWKLIHEVAPDMAPFRILLLSMDYNNLKAVIKSKLETNDPQNVLIEGGSVPLKTIQTAISEKRYSMLPDAHMEIAAKTAYEAFIQTADGQICDAILDRACLRAMLDAGEQSGNEMLAEYAELVVAIANIKIAVRSCKVHKDMAFIRSAVVPCKTLAEGQLVQAAARDIDAVFAYLAVTPYAKAAEALKNSYSAFEKWCDDKIMSLIKGEKLNFFSVGPLFAYAVARQNEINMTRIILAAKRSGLDQEIIRERQRDMYV